MSQPSVPRRLWYGLLQHFLQLVAIVVYQARYSGRKNIPTSGGVLVVSNHQSHLDPPLIGIGVPRRMNYLARKTLLRFKPFGWLLLSVNAIPIDRDGFGLSGIKESLKRLKHGEMVTVFPEGTRTRDGEIAPFRAGFAALAVRSNAAILPAAIDGAYQAFPRWKRFPGPGRIRVHYGRPILPSEFAGRTEHELVAEVERRVRACHALLCTSRAAPSQD